MTSEMRLDEYVAVVGVIDPDAYTAGEQLTAAIDMSKWESLLCIVMAGDLGTNATVDAAIKASATSGGTYAAITGKAITQLTQSPDDSNKQALVHLRASEMPAGKRYVKLSMTVATATSDAGAIVLGKPAHAFPATDNDLSSVDEVVG